MLFVIGDLHSSHPKRRRWRRKKSGKIVAGRQVIDATVTIGHTYRNIDPCIYLWMLLSQYTQHFFTIWQLLWIQFNHLQIDAKKIPFIFRNCIQLRTKNRKSVKLTSSVSRSGISMEVEPIFNSFSLFSFPLFPKFTSMQCRANANTLAPTIHQQKYALSS